MAVLIYSLCAITAFLCSFLLLQAFMRSQYRLLLWGGLCFAFLTMNNILLIADKLIFPYSDFSTERLVAALIAMLILLYGLIWDKE
jgi:hypothetical protein